LDTARLGFSAWSEKDISDTLEIWGNSEVTFNVKNGDEIKFFCDSSVKKGTLKITLTDSNGKLIKNFQTNKNDKEQIYLVKKGKYILSATYDNFIGNYTVKYK
jgi:hypothetical protein